MSIDNGHLTEVLASMAPGIGDLTYGTTEWVEAAQSVLDTHAHILAESLEDSPSFKICVVGHNPPAYLHLGRPIAWHCSIQKSNVEVNTGELSASDCDLKIVGDHSIISNIARIVYHGNDPQVVVAARERLAKLSRWEIQGSTPKDNAVNALLRKFHDSMAHRTMPRFVFMTPEWVSSARYILSTRVASEKYAEGVKDVVFTFSEEFTDTPEYAFPDGTHGGFWVLCDHGEITVGAGPLPKELEPADMLTKGKYTPVVPVGRTVNAALTDEEKVMQGEYSKSAFKRDEHTQEFPVQQSMPSGRGPMPPELGRVFMVLHDELSMRTSSELPSDFDAGVKADWATSQPFDRDPSFDKSWIKYDTYDIYGNIRET